MKKNFKISLLLISNTDIAQQAGRGASWEQNTLNQNSQHLMFLQWIPKGTKVNEYRGLMNISWALNTIR